MSLLKSDYDFELPQELIAQDPLEDRSASRLLVLNRETGEVSHHVFRELVDYLRAGDCIVLNDTKVIPARLIGEREDDGGRDGSGRDGGSVNGSCRIEVLLLKRREADVREAGSEAANLREAAAGETNAGEASALWEANVSFWEALVKPGKKCRPGARLSFGGGLLKAQVLEILEGGSRLIRFTYSGIWEEVLDRLGEMPLPPYITHKLADRNRYQTVYAKQEGSAAAPTAGLHFTRELLDEIRRKGVDIAAVTLHVGLGTFRPVKEENILEHHMHSEHYEITAETAAQINRAKSAGGRIVCVGTTSCRALESAADGAGRIRPGSGDTNIFIYPGYQFKVLDALVTNFHLPESTLIMLVSALAGRERTLAAYREAVRERYRFFSFGDAMLIC